MSLKARTALVAALALVLVGVLWLVLFSGGGQAAGRLPVNEGRVKRTLPMVLMLGEGKLPAWHWRVAAAERTGAWGGGKRECFSVHMAGPLVHVAGGSMSGNGSVGKKCGPVARKGGVAVSLPTKGGELSLPMGQSEAWQSFDVGVGAYPPSVGRVRLIFAGGHVETMRARSVPKRLAFKKGEPFHYVVFAVYGCVRELQGLADGHVVADIGLHGCAA